jgi:hypothetical protein
MRQITRAEAEQRKPGSTLGVSFGDFVWRIPTGFTRGHLIHVSWARHTIWSQSSVFSDLRRLSPCDVVVRMWDDIVCLWCTVWAVRDFPSPGSVDGLGMVMQYASPQWLSEQEIMEMKR